jgi:hypothetical protein
VVTGRASSNQHLTEAENGSETVVRTKDARTNGVIRVVRASRTERPWSNGFAYRSGRATVGARVLSDASIISRSMLMIKIAEPSAARRREPMREAVLRADVGPGSSVLAMRPWHVYGSRCPLAMRDLP